MEFEARDQRDRKPRSNQPTLASATLEKEPDAIVKLAYANFIREPLRTFARGAVQRRNGVEVKDALVPIGDAVLRGPETNGELTESHGVYIPVGPIGVPITGAMNLTPAPPGPPK